MRATSYIQKWFEGVEQMVKFECRERKFDQSWQIGDVVLRGTVETELSISIIPTELFRGDDAIS